MSALTGPRDTIIRDGKLIPAATAAVQFYKGGAAAIVLGVGFATPLVPATITHKFYGVFTETYNNSSGTAGGYFTTIQRNGVAYFDSTGITAASIGEPAYFSDDHTITVTAGTTYAGRIVSVDAAGLVGVDITDAVMADGNNGRDWIPVAASSAINPHVSANYLITKAGVAANTLAAPTAGTDDGVEIFISSSTAYAHTLTATGLLNTGSASVNAATSAAYAGAGVRLKAYNGTWNVVHQIGQTFS